MPGPMTKVGVRSSSTLNFFFFFFKGLLCPVGVVMFSLEHHFSQQKKYVVIFFCLLNFLPPPFPFLNVRGPSPYIFLYMHYILHVSTCFLELLKPTMTSISDRKHEKNKKQNKNEKKNKKNEHFRKRRARRRRKNKVIWKEEKLKYTVEARPAHLHYANGLTTQ